MRRPSPPRCGWVPGWCSTSTTCCRPRTLRWSLEEAVDISDNGWITGNGWFTATPGADPLRRGWAMQLSADFIAGLPPGPLFPPPGAVPEPGTLALLGLGIAGLALSRRRVRRPSTT